MASKSVAAIIAETTGNMAGANDKAFDTLAMLYQLICDLSWPWNWDRTDFLTFAEEQEVGASGALTFSWNAGEDYVTASEKLELPLTMTGRYAFLGDQWYRIVDYGYTVSTRFYVDRKIASSDANVQGAAVPLVRFDYGVRTNIIRSVELNKYKIPRSSEDWLMRQLYTNRNLTTNSLQLRYVDINSPIRPPAPIYPPSITLSAGGTHEAGKYLYFFTRYDKESELESDPGPSVLYVSKPADHHPVIAYGNPLGDFSDDTSFTLRLYRSNVNAGRVDPPVFLIDARPPTAPTTPFVDTNDGSIRGKGHPQLYRGHYVAVMFYPACNTVYSLQVFHNRTYGFRASPEEIMETGQQNAVMELMMLYVKTILLNAGNGNENDFQLQIRAFRGQLNYLISQQKEAGASDIDTQTWNPVQPGFGQNQNAPNFGNPFLFNTRNTY